MTALSLSQAIRVVFLGERLRHFLIGVVPVADIGTVDVPGARQQVDPQRLLIRIANELGVDVTPRRLAESHAGDGRE